MIKKVRKETIPLSLYLSDVKNGDISKDQDVQRGFCSDNSFVNELAVTILTEDYLPPIILGEIRYDKNLVQKYVVDGNQRTVAMSKIRYGKYRISQSIENSVIKYQEKKRDENGVVIKNENDDIEWESKTFDIKGKRFEDFPEPLQKKFDTYQLETVIHQECTKEDLSFLVRRYNNHRSMNTSQRLLTYMDVHARKIKSIAENRFFKDSIHYSERQSVNGIYQRAVGEAVMCCFHEDSWAAISKKNGIFLNENATSEEFDTVDDYTKRMEAVCRDNFCDIFIPKNIPVWIAVFKEFTTFGLPDDKFVDFLNAFTNDLKNHEIDGKSWEYWNSQKSTKDSKTIHGKIDYLKNLIRMYFNIDGLLIKKPDITDKKENTKIIKNVTVNNEQEININQDKDTMNNIAENNSNVELLDYNSILRFLKSSVSDDITVEDLKVYREDLETLTLDVDNKSKLLEPVNYKSLFAIMAYAYKNDIELDKWFVEYFKKENTYETDQTKNYLKMRNSLITFTKNVNVA